MVRLMVATAVAVLVASCAAPGRGDSVGGRYIDPYTCEIKNKRAEDPPYDPECIQAAQRAAINAAKNSQKGQMKK